MAEILAEMPARSDTLSSLSAATLLDVWERGAALSPVRHALLLLSVASPEESVESLAVLPIGERDARLLRLREACFGRRITSVAACSSCGERLDLSFDTSDITASPTGAYSEIHSIALDGFDVRFRLPNSLDLLTLSAVGNTGRDDLLARCLLEQHAEGEPIEPGSIPRSVLDAVVDRMAEMDPQADVTLALQCPSCSHAWVALFDIVSFLRREIEIWAERVLLDIHILASRYGWSEADILNLGASRRQRYVEMATG